jgi:hypothetical protein
MAKRKVRQPKSRSTGEDGVERNLITEFEVVAAHVAPTWADRMQILTRGDVPVTMLRFFAYSPPKHMVEIVRLHTPTGHIKEMVDAMCKNLDYYPTKPTSKA